jgi:uncharacterized protein (DUF983 family)
MFYDALVLLWRGMLLRCPVCGRGRLFRRWFKMNEQCPVCGFHFEREEGYFTGAMAVNLIIAEVLLTAAVIPLALQPWISLLWLFVFGVVLSVSFPLLFYRHSKALWMSIDHLLHPVDE